MRLVAHPVFLVSSSRFDQAGVQGSRRTRRKRAEGGSLGLGAVSDAERATRVNLNRPPSWGSAGLAPARWRVGDRVRDGGAPLAAVEWIDAGRDRLAVGAPFLKEVGVAGRGDPHQVRVATVRCMCSVAPGSVIRSASAVMTRVGTVSRLKV